MITTLTAPVALAFAGVLGALARSRQIESRFPPVGELVDIGPGALHCVETPAEGEARGVIALVHGASGNFADLHEALAGRLAALGFRVFAFDRPGHGWSGRLAPRQEASSPEQQAEWIRLALARRGVDEAIIVVHSLAGVLGLAMALNAPQFVRGLVLLAPVSHPWPGGVSLYYTVSAAPVVGRLFTWFVAPWVAPIFMPSGLQSVFAPQPTPPNYVERTRLTLLLRPWQWRANAEDVVDIEAHVRRLHKRYGEIRAPTAVVTGDKDSVVYADIHSAGCARDIPGATLKVLHGVGHSPHYADPDSVIAAILEVEARAEARRREG